MTGTEAMGAAGRPSLPESLAGVGTTAIGVALIRAREHERADRLFADPYAPAFADAARRGFLDPDAPVGAADTWQTIERLVDSFYEGRVIGVHLVDMHIREAVAAGFTQVVVLGAGLDTRAFRLSLPPELRWFEVDLPAMFDFKEPVLAAQGAVPDCARHVVPADLRGDWSAALCDAGLRRAVPTLWIEEGVLGYLPREQARDVVRAMGGLSAPGSRFGVGLFTVDESAPHYRTLRSLASSGETEMRPQRGLSQDVVDWLHQNGWRTEFRSWDEQVKGLSRAARTGDPANGHLLVTRE